MGYLKSFENYTRINENKTRPKSNLEVGDFLLAYYRGIDKGIMGCYRVVTVNRSGYTVMDIQKYAAYDHIPLSVIDENIIGTELFNKDESGSCFDIVSKDVIKSMVIDVDKIKAIDYIMETPHVVSGVKRGEEREYWENSEPNTIANKYAREINGGKMTEDTFKIVRLTENGSVIYNPFGDFKTSGHKNVSLSDI